MKADAIMAKIIDDARSTAAQTLSDANARAQQIRQRAEEEGIKKRAETMDQARRECIELRDRMLRMAELDQRKAQLAVKREVIEQAFEAALQKMSAMPAKQKLTYMERLIVDNAQGDEEIVVSAEDAKLFDAGYIGRLNAELTKIGKISGLTLSDERREMDGGVILKKNGMEVNCTFRAMLNQIRPSLEASVAQMLFGESR